MLQAVFSGRLRPVIDTVMPLDQAREAHERLEAGGQFGKIVLVPYKDRFVNGLFMHAFLSPADYHRQHAPVGGTVLEARVIPGQVYLEVTAQPVGDGTHRLHPLRAFDAPDNAGYQFAQARGLVVLDTPIGLVAVLPIGMCQVSSVVMTAEVGVTLRKGEEISYFQFGGSDIVVLFEAKSNVSFTAQPNVHYKMGTRIAQAFPVI
jgi:phosphatidylserine decarboxylase